ncbi:helix-turn-helix transcriptional regulator [Streptomyces sp. AV19]|uniref:helix-turn-helix domain-containing protein n=1 Tax=Streptomyces sp. AV19 TaxID=2793068 RepID=UPI0018FEF600|nr:helix-turn-helix transcriptional regulator [Streptomyces sp. AV19]MBH1937588.1 helix-turn-helix transcriptional regulator [Streptomyces sp. AV19]MDG4536479.1 helix-turn-helix transcriptional regulator [Streptomyces sp. AV19]
MALERHSHLSTDDVFVADVRCGDPPHGWSEVRPAAVFGLLLVRRGVVRGRIEGVEQLLDPTTVFVERLGSERQFAHPCCGVAYTEIVLSEPSMAEVLGGDPVVPEGSAYTSTQVDVMHRLLLARIRAGDGDPFELAERTVELVSTVFGQLAPARVASGQPTTAAARKQVVDDTREVLGKDPLIGLEGLSRAVGCSPHHLSRVFSAITGTTLTHYRNRLRVAGAMDRLSEGETDLRLLANDLGFTDQAHMTHVVRKTAGLPPGRLRSLLGTGAGR